MTAPNGPTDDPDHATPHDAAPVDDAAGEAPRPRRAGRVAALVGLIVVTAAATTLLVGRNGGRPGGPEPLDLATVSENIAGRYRHAAAHADAYREIPCWCGCQQFLGHRNLADCFVRPDGRGWEAHAAGCGVCNGEAAIAERMLVAGKTPAEITEAVNAEFGTTAITLPRR